MKVEAYNLIWKELLKGHLCLSQKCWKCCLQFEKNQLLLMLKIAVGFILHIVSKQMYVQSEQQNYLISILCLPVEHEIQQNIAGDLV